MDGFTYDEYGSSYPVPSIDVGQPWSPSYNPSIAPSGDVFITGIGANAPIGAPVTSIDWNAVMNLNTSAPQQTQLGTQPTTLQVATPSAPVLGIKPGTIFTPNILTGLGSMIGSVGATISSNSIFGLNTPLKTQQTSLFGSILGIEPLHILLILMLMSRRN